MLFGTFFISIVGHLFVATSYRPPPDKISTGSIPCIWLNKSKLTESVISVCSVRHEVQFKFNIRTINCSLDSRHKVHPDDIHVDIMSYCRRQMGLHGWKGCQMDIHGGWDVLRASKHCIQRFYGACYPMCVEFLQNSSILIESSTNWPNGCV